MHKIVDLSLPIDADTQVYPGDPQVRFSTAATIEADGFNLLHLFHTGWPVHYGTPTYFDHPYLSVEACTALLDRGVRTFCLDVLNIDETPDDDHPGAGFPVHPLAARVGGIVVENLTGLERIDFADPFLTVFPLRLSGADGSPTRAVALQLAPDSS